MSQSTDKEARECVRCGSSNTYYRVSDGDIGCNDCAGIMPVQDEDEEHGGDR